MLIMELKVRGLVFLDVCVMSKSVFGVDFSHIGKEKLIQDLLAVSDRFEYIVTPNVNHVVQLEESEGLVAAYSSAKWIICDSRILKLLAKVLGREVGEVIPGSSLTAEVFELAAKKALAVTIVGAGENDIQILRNKYPEITIHHYYPPMGFIDHLDEIKKCVDFVVTMQASLVFLAVGCPRQEILAKYIYDSGLARGVGLCIGASILFLSGSLSRAPIWVQRLHLEWLYRMFSEPKRLVARYVADAFKMLLVIKRELCGK